MTDLAAALGEAASEAFARLGLERRFGRVTASDRPELADFQVNGALAAAKAAGRAPREIAQAVAEALRNDARLASVEVAGPGFVNLRVTDSALGARAAEIAADPRAGVSPVETPRRVLVDYGGPNVAKEMHVGHLRASIIGESVKRIYRFRGDQVVGDAHFGDWGLQMGLLVCAVFDQDPEIRAVLEPLVEQPPGFSQADEDAIDALLSRIGLDDLDRLYPAAAERNQTEPAYRERARRATAELQAGRFGYRLLWKHFARVTRTALERDFHALGVDFDLWKGESDVDPLIAPMIDDLKQKGLLFSDQGAEIVRVNRNDDKRDLPPLIVVSSEGSAMYGTTDLATIIDRRESFDPELVLYIVDQRQADHFEVVFRAAVLAGYAAECVLQHIGFGTMNGTDGKPFKTRAGGVVKLRDLIDMVAERARERLHEAGLGTELSAEAFEATALKVAVATLKFADLSKTSTPAPPTCSTSTGSPASRAGPGLTCSTRRSASNRCCARRRRRGPRPGQSRSARLPSGISCWCSTLSTTLWPRLTTSRRPTPSPSTPIAWRRRSRDSTRPARCWPPPTAPPAAPGSRSRTSLWSSWKPPSTCSASRRRSGCRALAQAGPVDSPTRPSPPFSDSRGRGRDPSRSRRRNRPGNAQAKGPREPIKRWKAARGDAGSPKEQGLTRGARNLSGHGTAGA